MPRESEMFSLSHYSSAQKYSTGFILFQIFNRQIKDRRKSLNLLSSPQPFTEHLLYAQHFARHYKYIISILITLVRESYYRLNFINGDTQRVQRG